MTPPTAPLTVVVVDDSAVQRRFLRAVIDADPALTVAGEARNGREAVALVERLGPDAVLMDLHLPQVGGIEAIEQIMATRPTPILVYSAFVEGDHRVNAQAALAAGAVDVLPKPRAEQARLDEHAETLRQRLRVVGRARVIKHPRGRLRLVTDPPAGPDAPNLRPPIAGAARPACGPVPAAAAGAGVSPRAVELIAIGASTGGPPALAQVLGALPAGLAAAVLVVQHMADGFVEGLAEWLDDLCALPVAVGRHGHRLQPGTVTLAPTARNIVVHDRLRVTVEEPPPTQYHVPGIDVTFESVARAVGSCAVGVLLTGMGRDGAHGLRLMHEAGGFTIAQDEASSAVYGMPAAAMAEGGVDVQLPLGDVSATLLHLCGLPAPSAEAAP